MRKNEGLISAVGLGSTGEGMTCCELFTVLRLPPQQMQQMTRGFGDRRVGKRIRLPRFAANSRTLVPSHFALSGRLAQIPQVRLASC